MANENGHSTIFSVSSGVGLAGIAIIRISGPNAHVCIDLMCAQKLKPRYVNLRKIFHPTTKELLDQGIVIWFPAPATFTGENVVEFHIHGGYATVDAVIEGLSRIQGFIQAEAGEFTRRAFLNGRLDLVEIEGLGDLIHAQTQAQRRQAISQTIGTASEVFNSWRNDLISLLGYLEASIDFSDEEDVSESALRGTKEKLNRLRNNMEKHLVDSARGQAVRDGVRVVLAGEPNVGKSSILNYLAKRDVAIVSNLPGTTRDVLEVQLEIGGVSVFLSDTAGLRDDARDEIEVEGIKRTHYQLQQADMIIQVVVAGQSFDNLSTPEGVQKAIIHNKSDLPHKTIEDGLYVSVVNGVGMEELYSMIAEFVKSKFGGSEPAIITRERQKAALKSCIAHLKAAQEENGKSLELIAEQLRLASFQLARLVGRIDVEDLLDVIFKDFCVGK